MTITLGDETLTPTAGQQSAPGTILGETLTGQGGMPLPASIDPTKLDDGSDGSQTGAAAPTAGFDYSGTTTGSSKIADKIIAAARGYLGVNYVYGGNDHTGIDCSGLTRAAYAAAGISLPRISFQQANHGTEVSQKEAKPGDLVAWDDSSRNPGADHIAIYLGNGMILESPRPGKKVRIRKLGGWSADSNAWFVRIPGVY